MKHMITVDKPTPKKFSSPITKANESTYRTVIPKEVISAFPQLKEEGEIKFTVQQLDLDVYDVDIFFNAPGITVSTTEKEETIQPHKEKDGIQPTHKIDTEEYHSIFSDMMYDWYEAYHQHYPKFNNVKNLIWYEDVLKTMFALSKISKVNIFDYAESYSEEVYGLDPHIFNQEIILTCSCYEGVPCLWTLRVNVPGSTDSVESVFDDKFDEKLYGWLHQYFTKFYITEKYAESAYWEDNSECLQHRGIEWATEFNHDDPITKKQQYVYVMFNRDMPGLVKIGCTKQLNERRKGLSSGTNVPGQFEILGYILTEDCYKLEKEVHQYLDTYRYDKEFFKLNLFEVNYLLYNSPFKFRLCPNYFDGLKKNIRVNGHASEKDKLFSIIQVLKHSKDNTLSHSEIRKAMNEKYDMPEYEVDDLINKLCSKGVIYSPVSDKFKCA